MDDKHLRKQAFSLLHLFKHLIPFGFWNLVTVNRLILQING